jgi:hypothetical protein
MSIAWTPGTQGLVSGEAILVTETRPHRTARQIRGKLRGKWILAQPPIDMRAQWDPVARRLTLEQLDALENACPPA